jgi:hypothetical protein
MKADFHNLDRMFPKARVLNHKSDAPTLDAILVLIPTWDVCDKLVELYALHFEVIHKILHMPTFLANYQRFQGSDPSMMNGNRYVKYRLPLYQLFNITLHLKSSG